MVHSINNCSAVCREFAGLGVSDPNNDEVRDCHCDRFVTASGPDWLNYAAATAMVEEGVPEARRALETLRERREREMPEIRADIDGLAEGIRRAREGVERAERGMEKMTRRK